MNYSTIFGKEDVFVFSCISNRHYELTASVLLLVSNEVSICVLVQSFLQQRTHNNSVSYLLIGTLTAVW